MKNLWLNIYTTNTGAKTIIDAAISNVQSVVYNPWNDASPIGKVLISIEFITISGHIKSFQAPRKTNVESVAIAGFESGNMIFQNICQRLSPSIIAASSSSFGIVKKNCLNMNVPYAVKIPGKISA